jgi:hypothetical protein
MDITLRNTVGLCFTWTNEKGTKMIMKTTLKLWDSLVLYVLVCNDAYWYVTMLYVLTRVFPLARVTTKKKKGG